jgi:hypothetical protein
MLRRQQAWKAMEARPFPVGGSLSTACKGGRWLYSWEASVSPSIDRVFHRFNDGGPLNLVSARDARLKYGRDDVGDSEVIRFVSDDFSNLGDVARDVLLNWPNSMADVAQAVGLSLKELRVFLRGKFDCGRSANLRLQSLLGIGYDDFVEGLVYRPAGPCALLVQNGAALERVYEDYSHGGDASPFEVVPASGRADPSWRYFSLNSYGGGLIIVMCLRGEKVADRMADILMNFEGEIVVADDVYRDVVSSCAKACLDVQRNSDEIAGLAARCGASLNNITFF